MSYIEYSRNTGKLRVNMRKCYKQQKKSEKQQKKSELPYVGFAFPVPINSKAKITCPNEPRLQFSLTYLREKSILENHRIKSNSKIQQKMNFVSFLRRRQNLRSKLILERMEEESKAASLLELCEKWKSLSQISNEKRADTISTIKKAVQSKKICRLMARSKTEQSNKIS